MVPFLYIYYIAILLPTYYIFIAPLDLFLNKLVNKRSLTITYSQNTVRLRYCQIFFTVSQVNLLVAFYSKFEILEDLN